MENVILIDFPTPEKWEFKEALEQASNKKWSVLSFVSYRDYGTSLKKLFRYVKYFIFSLKIFFKRSKYKTILSWQQFYGLILAFYCQLFKVKNAPNILIMFFIYKTKESVLGCLYFKFIKYILSSRYINKIVVCSKNEMQYYSEIFEIPREKFYVIKLAIKDVKSEYESEICADKYFVSAGRSNRDYQFLRDAWIENTSLFIVCDNCKDKDTDDIHYLKSCYDSEFLELLAKAYVSIIPLKNEEISSGQLVILKSFMFGKPVIVTKNSTVTEYVEDGVDGFIINKDEKSLKEAIERLNNPEIYEKMSQNARMHFEKDFSLAAMGTTIGKLYKELM